MNDSQSIQRPCLPPSPSMFLLIKPALMTRLTLQLSIRSHYLIQEGNISSSRSIHMETLQLNCTWCELVQQHKKYGLCTIKYPANGPTFSQCCNNYGFNISAFPEIHRNVLGMSSQCFANTAFCT